ncbi:hypothetical protein P152DRAFT_445159 [Eremomyces bilateralis CBS 781.70]|uniref:Uncharacterized protein n=1 Tax=Eremomyces bilateralis CBS 781.70 TaxID=1392243 RepID=A0A6G1GG58_9PEZI|nr:uncharacterized protein P152DRAFT_445159 [Eremomyces bilateralis CBS 781.70]KAF1817004.1 hypothetical protein P152DRAFT_445159 [Eremomyces bilateralis CBS 781.70]
MADNQFILSLMPRHYGRREDTSKLPGLRGLASQANLPVSLRTPEPDFRCDIYTKWTMPFQRLLIQKGGEKIVTKILGYAIDTVDVAVLNPSRFMERFPVGIREDGQMFGFGSFVTPALYPQGRCSAFRTPEWLVNAIGVLRLEIKLSVVCKKWRELILTEVDLHQSPTSVVRISSELLHSCTIPNRAIYANPLFPDKPYTSIQIMCSLEDGGCNTCAGDFHAKMDLSQFDCVDFRFAPDGNTAFSVNPACFLQDDHFDTAYRTIKFTLPKCITHDEGAAFKIVGKTSGYFTNQPTTLVFDLNSWIPKKADLMPPALARAVKAFSKNDLKQVKSVVIKFPAKRSARQQFIYNMQRYQRDGPTAKRRDWRMRYLTLINVTTILWEYVRHLGNISPRLVQNCTVVPLPPSPHKTLDEMDQMELSIFRTAKQNRHDQIKDARLHWETLFNLQIPDDENEDAPCTLELMLAELEEWRTENPNSEDCEHIFSKFLSSSVRESYSPCSDSDGDKKGLGSKLCQKYELGPNGQLQELRLVYGDITLMSRTEKTEYDFLKGWQGEPGYPGKVTLTDQLGMIGNEYCHLDMLD